MQDIYNLYLLSKLVSYYDGECRNTSVTGTVSACQRWSTGRYIRL